MKQPGHDGQGQSQCIRRDGKSFFICWTASWSGSGNLESTIPATMTLPSRNLSAMVIVTRIANDYQGW